MRLRLPELLAKRGPDGRDLSAYALAQLCAGRVSPSTCYRLVEKRGMLATFDAELLEALCDVLQLEPGDLFEREAVKATRATGGKGRSSTAASRRRAR